MTNNAEHLFMNSFAIGFPSGSDGKETACNVGDLGLIPGLGRSPEEGNGYPLQYPWGFLGGSVVKNPPANARDAGDIGLIPESGRSPGEGNDNPFHCSCLGNILDRGAWQAPVLGIAKESDII